MIIRGVIEYTFGGALCFRGFAKIGDLAKISIADIEAYQREADLERANKILDFLSESKYRFFPELVFGLKFNDPNAIQNIIGGKKKNFIDGINYNLYTKDFKDYNSVSQYDSPLLRRISLEFTDNTTKYLTRIDGNHRLSAIDNLDDSDPKKAADNYTKLNYLVPFCIILQDKSDDAEKFENAYFYLINSKSKPLTSEENLKAILTSNHFAEADIIDLLGSNGVKAKQLLKKIDSYSFQGINTIIENKKRSFVLGCFDLCTKNGIDVEVEEMQNHINNIDILYFENDTLKNNGIIEILISFVYFKVVEARKKNKIFTHFTNWIITNHLFTIKDIKAESIAELFTQIHEKKSYKVFVAMPYWSHQEVNEYNTLFKEILLEVTKKAKVELELIPIMRFRGKSQRIDKRLLNSINECDIFIADITGNNDNVIFEIGYAEAKEKHMIIIKSEKDESVVPFDMDKLQWIPYQKETYYNSIKGIIKNNLAEILRKEHGILI